MSLRWVCPACGSNNMPQSGACFRCGASQPLEPTLQSPPPRPNYRGIKRTIAGLVAVGALAALLLLWRLPRNSTAFMPIPLPLPHVPNGPTTAPAGTAFINETGPVIVWYGIDSQEAVGSFNNKSSVPIEGVKITTKITSLRGERGFITDATRDNYVAEWDQVGSSSDHRRLSSPQPARYAGFATSPITSVTVQPGDSWQFNIPTEDRLFPVAITVTDASGNTLEVVQRLGTRRVVTR